MKFGYFDTRVDPGGKRSYDQLIDDLREEVVLSEQAGYDAAWIGEHHMGPEGMDQPVWHWTPSIAVCGIQFYV